jgi:hypothetical protein
VKHTHGGYGNFIGGDPRRFTPDSLDSGTTPAEMKAWETACAAWNEAEARGAVLQAEPGSCERLVLRDADGKVTGAAIVTLTRFGLGGYEYDCDDPDCDDQPAQDWDDEVAS